MPNLKCSLGFHCCHDMGTRQETREKQWHDVNRKPVTFTVTVDLPPDKCCRCGHDGWKNTGDLGP